MEQELERITDHYILWGYGRVGRQIARELRREGAAFVVIDADPQALERARADGLLVVQGNATEDSTLREAGIARSCGPIPAVATDADNIFVTFSAHARHPDLPIVARANRDDAMPKLQRAGATHVVSPYAMAGQQMAMLATRPSAVNFVETLLHGTHSDLLLEDVRVAEGSPLVGATLAAARGRFAPEVTVLALRRGGSILTPSPELILQPGDALAMTGTAGQFRTVEAACAGALAREPT